MSERNEASLCPCCGEDCGPASDGVLSVSVDLLEASSSGAEVVRSQAFSGLCRECAERLYGKVADRVTRAVKEAADRIRSGPPTEAPAEKGPTP